MSNIQRKVIRKIKNYFQLNSNEIPHVKMCGIKLKQCIYQEKKNKTFKTSALKFHFLQEAKKMKKNLTQSRNANNNQSRHQINRNRHQLNKNRHQLNRKEKGY